MGHGTGTHYLRIREKEEATSISPQGSNSRSDGQKRSPAAAASPLPLPVCRSAAAFFSPFGLRFAFVVACGVVSRWRVAFCLLRPGFVVSFGFGMLLS